MYIVFIVFFLNIDGLMTQAIHGQSAPRTRRRLSGHPAAVFVHFYPSPAPYDLKEESISFV